MIMDPELTGVFIHEALGHAAEADSVKNGGESILAGRVGGERIASEELTVVDDPTYRAGSVPTSTTMRASGGSGLR